MRNYKKILQDLQDQRLSDYDVYNRSGGQKDCDPKEAVATIQAIRIYRKNNTEFAEYIRRQINE